MIDRTNLPGWAVDLIRDGVPPRELRARGDRAVWDELGRTALSAIAHGWSRPEWEYLVLEPGSDLGRQARLTSSGKVRTPRSLARTLTTAWERAEKRAEESPAWTTETARDEAVRRAQRVRDLAADPDVLLPDAQRTLLCHAADRAESTGRTLANLPLQPTAEATGLTVKAVRYHLGRLDAAGLLVLVERGRWVGDPRKAGAKRNTTPRRTPRASVYQLPDVEALATYLSRETRQVCPKRQTGVPQPDSGSVPQHQTGVPQPAMTEEAAVPALPIPGPNVTDEEWTVMLQALVEHRASADRTAAGERHLYVVREETR
ncbi:helix-turn-helix domain-containing protein [Nocardioides antri]|uniref:Helix-turn-helix transcriptional regulator n=1 Tax=Nocardioides antri TaxID=2607659 RepID=A0A5B1M7N0_9ACTN|nr:helix-turn-helix domain-containing protein [Nocardioides antri]KAA1427867.1 helix-turn-helix transcriptional regulator [Nocardioides antri]